MNGTEASVGMQTSPSYSGIESMIALSPGRELGGHVSVTAPCLKNRYTVEKDSDNVTVISL
jgi:hypothetical protein